MTLGRSELASLVLVALALASVTAVFLTRNEATTEERSARENHLIPVFEKGEITRVELMHGGRELVLGRTSAGFELERPVAEPADPAAVDRLLDGLGFATLLRRLTAIDRKTLGLTPARARLTLVMGRRKLTLSLGAAAPAPAGAAYVELAEAGGEPAAGVVTKEVAELLLLESDDFRERAIVPLGPSQLAELVLTRPKDSVRLVAGQGLAFRLDGEQRASRDHTEPLFAALAGLAFTRFLEPGAAEQARSNAPLVGVQAVAREAARSARVELGGACPGTAGEVLAIARTPRLRAGCVRDDALAQFSVEKSLLVDTAPFAARKDEVESLAIARGDKRLVLARRGNGFLLREPSEAELDLDTGNQRLETLLRAPAEIVAAADPATVGLAPPAGSAVVTFVGRDDKAAEEAVDIGAPRPDGTLFVRRREDGVVLRLAAEPARAFGVDATLLRSRRLLDFPLSALAELELTAPEHQLLRRTAGGFALVEPAGFTHDGELATEAALALGSLTALRWIADQDDGSFGLAKPTLTARFRIDSSDAGASDRTLSVGRAVPGGYYARLADAAGVFLLERAVVERLGTLLVDRSPFVADRSVLARVSLSTSARAIVLESRDGDLVPSASSPIDAALLAAVAEALGGLKADAALHTGPALDAEGLATPALRVSYEPRAGLGQRRTFRIGAAGRYRDLPVRYARADGVNATFVIAEPKLRPLLDLF